MIIAWVYFFIEMPSSRAFFTAPWCVVSHTIVQEAQVGHVGTAVSDASKNCVQRAERTPHESEGCRQPEGGQ